MIPTPRTDAERRRLKKTETFPAEPVDAEFCRQFERESAAQKAALSKASASLSAFLGFHAEALPLEAVRGLSELLKEIQPLISPPTFTCAEPPAS